MEGLLKRQNPFTVTKVICRQSRLNYFLCLIFHFLFLFFVVFFFEGKGDGGMAERGGGFAFFVY